MTKLTAILDIDGTLVDSNYHHASAWYQAFRQNDVLVPLWKIHRHLGMGSDQLVDALIGQKVANEKGDDIRAAHGPLYLAMIEEVAVLPGARELITTLKEQGHAVVLASSAKADEVDHYLDLLEVREVVDGWTTSADVESTKPDPDLVESALAKAGNREAVMIGDTRWDCEAAARAGIPCIGVLSGGIADSELKEAGAVRVYESAKTLAAEIKKTPLAHLAKN